MQKSREKRKIAIARSPKKDNKGIISLARCYSFKNAGAHNERDRKNQKLNGIIFIPYPAIYAENQNGDCLFMSAIVVAGGISKRFGQDKGLVRLGEKPLVLHVLDKLAGVANEVFVAVNSERQKGKFVKAIKQKACIIVDRTHVQTPLAGALAGFENVKNKYTLLLACDTPFLSPEILKFLLDVCVNKTAAIPRWPNSNIEPLQATYHAKAAAQAAKTALEEGKLDMRSMIANMQNIRYISTKVLQQLDPKLITFFNINTPNDLREAETMTKHYAY